MTDPGRDLSRSRAVLIGTGRYTHLPQVPAARHSLDRMRSLLTGELCGWPADRVSVFRDPRAPGVLPDQLMELFVAAQDVALFYYVGHGQIDFQDTLCLGLVDSRTTDERRRTTSLPFDAVRYALTHSRAKVKIVILDCCYAGLANRPALSAGDIATRTRATGAYTLAAASEFATAWYETDPAIRKPQTFFTKYLADTIETGIAGEGADLRLEPIFNEVLEALVRDGKPEPTSRTADRAARFVFARNNAYRPPTPPSPAEPPPAAEPHPEPESTPDAPPDPAPGISSPTAISSRAAGPSATGGAPTGTGPPDSGPAPTAAGPEPTRRPARNVPRRVVLLGGVGILAAGVPTAVALWPDPSKNTGDAAQDTTTTPTISPTPKAVSSATNMRSLTGHTDWVASVAFSPDGTTLATGSGDKTARLWDLSTGHTTATLTSHTDTIWSVAFSLDGRTLATGSDATRLWEEAARRRIATLTGQKFSIYSVAFSPDGRTLATGAGDGTARLWDVTTDHTTATLTHTNVVHSVAFSPDGTTLATGCANDTARLWDVATGKTTATLTGHTDGVWSVVFSPDGKTLATGAADNTVRLWDVATGKTTATLTGHTDAIFSVAFSPDGKTLATGSDDKTVRLWDVTTGNTTATLTGQTGWFSSVAFSPDGTILAAGSGDKKVWLWDLA
jgi:Tol biopolymer transport system component